MIHQAIEELNKSIVIRPRYDNFIGGQWVPPARGQYFSNLMPLTGQPLCQVAKSTAEDIEKPAGELRSESARLLPRPSRRLGGANFLPAPRRTGRESSSAEISCMGAPASWWVVLSRLELPPNSSNG